MQAYVYTLAKVLTAKPTPGGDPWLLAFIVMFFGYVAWTMFQGPKK